MNPLSKQFLDRRGKMALFKWSKKYSVGVKELDNQHTELMAALNELHAAMMKGQAQSIADPMLLKLQSDAINHFSTEERLMESTKYPGLSKQRAEHQELFRSVEGYVARFKEGDNTMYRGLLFFLRDWFVNHEQQMDKEYTTWMNESGVR
jgi:hemerythrin-like metal-binding protein